MSVFPGSFDNPSFPDSPCASGGGDEDTDSSWLRAMQEMDRAANIPELQASAESRPPETVKNPVEEPQQPAEQHRTAEPLVQGNVGPMQSPIQQASPEAQLQERGPREDRERRNSPEPVRPIDRSEQHVQQSEHREQLHQQRSQQLQEPQLQTPEPCQQSAPGPSQSCEPDHDKQSHDSVQQRRHDRSHHKQPVPHGQHDASAHAPQQSEHTPVRASKTRQKQQPQPAAAPEAAPEYSLQPRRPAHAQQPIRAQYQQQQQMPAKNPMPAQQQSIPVCYTAVQQVVFVPMAAPQPQMPPVAPQVAAATVLRPSTFPAAAHATSAAVDRFKPKPPPLNARAYVCPKQRSDPATNPEPAAQSAAVTTSHSHSAASPRADLSSSAAGVPPGIPAILQPHTATHTATRTATHTAPHSAPQRPNIHPAQLIQQPRAPETQTHAQKASNQKLETAFDAPQYAHLTTAQRRMLERQQRKRNISEGSSAAQNTPSQPPQHPQAAACAVVAPAATAAAETAATPPAASAAPAATQASSQPPAATPPTQTSENPAAQTTKKKLGLYAKGRGLYAPKKRGLYAPKTPTSSTATAAPIPSTGALPPPQNNSHVTATPIAAAPAAIPAPAAAAVTSVTPGSTGHHSQQTQNSQHCEPHPETQMSEPCSVPCNVPCLPSCKLTFGSNLSQPGALNAGNERALQESATDGIHEEPANQRPAEAIEIMELTLSDDQASSEAEHRKADQQQGHRGVNANGDNGSGRQERTHQSPAANHDVQYNRRNEAQSMSRSDNSPLVDLRTNREAAGFIRAARTDPSTQSRELMGAQIREFTEFPDREPGAFLPSIREKQSSCSALIDASRGFTEVGGQEGYMFNHFNTQGDALESSEAHGNENALRGGKRRSTQTWDSLGEPHQDDLRESSRGSRRGRASSSGREGGEGGVRGGKGSESDRRRNSRDEKHSKRVSRSADKSEGGSVRNDDGLDRENRQQSNDRDRKSRETRDGVIRGRSRDTKDKKDRTHNTEHTHHLGDHHHHEHHPEQQQQQQKRTHSSTHHHRSSSKDRRTDPEHRQEHQRHAHKHSSHEHAHGHEHERKSSKSSKSKSSKEGKSQDRSTKDRKRRDRSAPASPQHKHGERNGEHSERGERFQSKRSRTESQRSTKGRSESKLDHGHGAKSHEIRSPQVCNAAAATHTLSSRKRAEVDAETSVSGHKSKRGRKRKSCEPKNAQCEPDASQPDVHTANRENRELRSDPGAAHADRASSVDRWCPEGSVDGSFEMHDVLEDDMPQRFDTTESGRLVECFETDSQEHNQRDRRDRIISYVELFSPTQERGSDRGNEWNMKGESAVQNVGFMRGVHHALCDGGARAAYSQQNFSPHQRCRSSDTRAAAGQDRGNSPHQGGFTTPHNRTKTARSSRASDAQCMNRMHSEQLPLPPPPVRERTPPPRRPRAAANPPVTTPKQPPSRSQQAGKGAVSQEKPAKRARVQVVRGRNGRFRVEEAEPVHESSVTDDVHAPHASAHDKPSEALPPPPAKPLCTDPPNVPKSDLRSDPPSAKLASANAHAKDASQKRQKHAPHASSQRAAQTCVVVPVATPKRAPSTQRSAQQQQQQQQEDSKPKRARVAVVRGSKGKFWIDQTQTAPSGPASEAAASAAAPAASAPATAAPAAEAPTVARATEAAAAAPSAPQESLPGPAVVAQPVVANVAAEHASKSPSSHPPSVPAQRPLAAPNATPTAEDTSLNPQQAPQPTTSPTATVVDSTVANTAVLHPAADAPTAGDPAAASTSFSATDTDPPAAADAYTTAPTAVAATATDVPCTQPDDIPYSKPPLEAPSPPEPPKPTRPIPLMATMATSARRFKTSPPCGSPTR